MAAQIFNQTIEGYWRFINKEGISDYSGVYFVYEAHYNSDTDTVTLLRLIYIGEANNIRDRIATHEKNNEWSTYVRPGNEICFSTCYADGIIRSRIEAAYIFQHKPDINTDYKYLFPFDQTTVISSGKTALLNTNFTIYRT